MNIINNDFIENPLIIPFQSPSGLWSDFGNYTPNWQGLTGVWTTDQTLYNNTIDFTISTPEDLSAFIRIINANSNYTFSGKTVTLTSDLDLEDHYWDMAGSNTNGPTNNFSGTFDGNNHTISNMNINYSAYNINYIGYGTDFGGFGLFAYLYKATVKI